MAYSINEMDPDVLYNIFANFNLKKLEEISLVSVSWKNLANKASLLVKVIFCNYAFNPNHWNIYCGNGVVNEEESVKAFNLLPNQIIEILKSRCSLFQNKKVMDTHMLVWIPEKIHGEISTIDNLGNLLKQNKKFSHTRKGFGFITDEILAKEGFKPIEGGWVLMSKDVIEKSRNKTYLSQENLIKKFNTNDKVCWRVPKLAEAVICIFAEFLRSGIFLFSEEPVTYTYCQEKINNYQIIIGGFSQNGFYIMESASNPRIGVAPICKLS